MKFSYQMDAKKVLSAFRRAPEVMTRHTDSGLNKAAMEMVSNAQERIRENDSIAFSLLVESIIFEKTGLLEWTVFAGAKHALFVELGTQPGYKPNGYAIEAWLKVRRASEPKRAAFKVMKHIEKHGTKAKPFFEPAFEKSEPSMKAIIERMVMQGVREVFG